MNLTILSFLLLFISTATIKTAQARKVKLVASVLLTDLNSILMYYNIVKENIPAYIHWPHNIDFYLERVEINNEIYVKVQGKFVPKTRKFLAASIKDLYFKKPARFFTMKKGKLIHLSHKSVLTYKQQEHKKVEKPYLSISYRSMDEVKTAIAPFYTKNKFYMDSYPPSPYLATWGEPRKTEQFLKYTTLHDMDSMGQFDNELMTLIGTFHNDEVTVTGLGPSLSKIVIYQNRIKILGNYRVPIDSPPRFVNNVLGVRMGGQGYLLEATEHRTRLLSNDAWDRDDVLPSANTFSVRKFVKLIRGVEPSDCLFEGLWTEDNMMYSGLAVGKDACERYQPKETKFNIYGHVLIKRVNYLEDGETTDPFCPIIIEYEREKTVFVIAGIATNYICTDNKRVWGGGLKRKSAYDPRKVYVSLLYELKDTYPDVQTYP